MIGSDDFLGQSFVLPYVKGRPRIVYFQGDLSIDGGLARRFCGGLEGLSAVILAG